MCRAVMDTSRIMTRNPLLLLQLLLYTLSCMSLVAVCESTENTFALDSIQCETIHNIPEKINLSSCSSQFEECFLSGYHDEYICEGCSLVSDTDSSLLYGIDPNCVCTCCWYQYIKNYCFKQLCSDSGEFLRFEEYTKSICEEVPQRTSLKPYNPDNSLKVDDQVQLNEFELFSSGENSLYRSLENDEQYILFHELSKILDFSSLGSSEFGLSKRDETDDVKPMLDSYFSDNELGDSLVYVDQKLDEELTSEDSLDTPVHKLVWGNSQVTHEKRSNDDGDRHFLDSQRFFEGTSREVSSNESAKGAFQSNVLALLDYKDDITFETIQGIYESYADNSKEFFAIAKSLLGATFYSTFYGAYQESSQVIEAQDTVRGPKGFCLKSESNALGFQINRINQTELALEVSGCFLNVLVKSMNQGLCSSSQHCSCKCSVIRGLNQCVKSYGKDLQELLQLTESDIIEYCEQETKVGIDEDSKGPISIYSDEKVQDDFRFLSNLKSVATALGFKDELDEVQAEFLWKSSITENTVLSDDVTASIIIDKCELENNDLKNYLQFDLDSCDIRGLYYCKNHFKGNKCSPYKNSTNTCDSACCLQIKMSQCAETHCASKKPVKEFQKIANLICTKYADPNITNGLPFPDAVESSTSDDFSQLSSTKTATSKCEYETKPPPDRTDLTPEKREVTALIDLSDRTDDVAKRVGKSVCVIDEFKPGYDTTNCDKREVKDCIKEGIQTLKDDPEHFCPYCTNDNAYDECRCACCFAKYFSKVCYDPNCKGLKEKLRYKRYVREVCKTKPVKSLFARSANRVSYASEDPQGIDSAARVSLAREQVEYVDYNSTNLDVLKDEYGATEQEADERPTNQHQELLNLRRKASLRSIKNVKRNQNEDQSSGEPSYDINTTEDHDGSVSESNVKRSGATSNAKKKQRTDPKAFTKKGAIRNSSTKKRIPSTFSPADRKAKVENAVPLLETLDDKLKRKKKVTGSHRASKKSSKKSTRRQPTKKYRTKEELFGSENPHAHLKEDPVAAKHRFVDSLIGTRDILNQPAKFKRDILYKTQELNTSAILTLNASSATVAVSNTTALLTSKRYKTITKTITKPKVKTLLTSSITSASEQADGKVEFVQAAVAWPKKTSEILSTEASTLSKSENSTSNQDSSATSTKLRAPVETVIVTVEIPATTTYIKTRFRPTTETETEYEETLTETETEYSNTLTSTLAKTTLYRYKDTTVTTETDFLTTTLIKSKTRLIPETTVTEYEESDKTITEKKVVPETITETWYEDFSTKTATTYSGTITTTAFKFTLTKYKFKKTGSTTVTETETEIERSIKTKWYPEYTVTEFETEVTKTKTKWYPSTTTDSTTTTTTTTVSSITTATATATTTAANAARPIPTVNLGPILSLIGRDLSKQDFDNEEEEEDHTENKFDFEHLAYTTQYSEEVDDPYDELYAETAQLDFGLTTDVEISESVEEENRSSLTSEISSFVSYNVSIIANLTKDSEITKAIDIKNVGTVKTSLGPSSLFSIFIGVVIIVALLFV